MPEKKEPFVPQEDRPDVELPKPDQPLSELRVRDLSALIGNALTLKPFFKEWKDRKQEKFEKPEHKEWKDHKHEWKEIKFEKYEKQEKFEKPEHKELKLEKIEVDGVNKQAGLEPGPDPTQRFEEVINQVIQMTTELKAGVDKLNERVAALEKTRNR